MNVLIIANGEIQNYSYYKNIIKKADLIICANGGYNHAKKFKVNPNYIIGDFDSIKLIPKNIEKIKYSKEKDDTDLELAVKFAKKKGAKTITIIGAIGDRVDLTLANLNILKSQQHIKIINEKHEIFSISKTTKITGKKGQIISFVPLTSNLTGIKTSGLKYPFTEKWFKKGKVSVSNEFTDNWVKIQMKKGQFLVIKSILDTRY